MSVSDLIQKGTQGTITSLQLIYDYYKHITTLSLGVILFISAFLKTGCADDFQKVFIIISIIAFLISIVFSLWIMQLIGRVMSSHASSQASAQKVDATSLLTPDQQLEELNKISIEMNNYLTASLAEANKVKRWIWPTLIAFLCGVFFAVIYIIVPFVL